jgi:hypothetical protein
MQLPNLIHLTDSALTEVEARPGGRSVIERGREVTRRLKAINSAALDCGKLGLWSGPGRPGRFVGGAAQR